MSRVKRGPKARKRRNKILKQASGYVGGRSRLIRSATETVDKGLTYAYRDRRVKKRTMRGLWQVRISAAAKDHDLSYSRLMHGLKKSGVQLDRKVLAELALRDAGDFATIAALAHQGLA